MATNNMQSKVCLITGSSSGIGKVTARELAKLGATVVMVCRNRTKGEAAQMEIQEVSGNNRVDLIVALATSPEVEEVSGKYFVNCKPIPSSRLSYDVTIRQRLWAISEELIRQNELSRLVPEK